MILQDARRLELVDDSPYRDKCLRDFIQWSEHYRPLSMVDRVVRAALSDDNLEINAFITFNTRDFVDICNRRSIKLLG